MITDYFSRLVCLCFASFFLVHAGAGVAIALLIPAALRRAEKMPARSAAAFLFSLRLLPFVMASCVIAALCVPSYLLLEPRSGTEPLGGLCATAAVLGLLSWLIAAARAVVALGRTLAFERSCRRSGSETRLAGRTVPALVVESRLPLLALSGLIRARLLLSRQVLEALQPEELDAALRHEEAHQSSRDNLKRLVCLLIPEVLPLGRCLAPLERSWAKYSEWAADDQASRGDSHRALWLASALLRVARMGSAFESELCATFTACGWGLEARVERLLRTETAREGMREPGRFAQHRELLLIGAFTATIVLLPGAMACVHRLLERLIQ